MEKTISLRSGVKYVDQTTGEMSSKDKEKQDKESNTVAQELRKLTTRIEEMSGSIRGEFNSHVERLESAIQKSNSEVLSELAKQSQELRAHLDAEIGRLDARIDTLEEKIKEPEVSKLRFDPDVSIVITGLPEDRSEDIQLKVLRLVSKGLGSEAVPVAVERMTSRGRGPGLVRAEFSSVYEKVALLRKKRQLRENQEYSSVYIRSAKSHTDRLIETNFKTLLREIPGGSEFYVAGNGRLLKRERPLSGPESRERGAGRERERTRLQGAEGGGGR